MGFDNLFYALQESERYLKTYRVANYRHVLIVMRELLFNAYYHGNDAREDREITAIITWESETAVGVTVEDQGEGFDYDALHTSLHGRITGANSRGYKLINAIASRIEFNEKGNGTTATVGVEYDASHKYNH